MQVIDSGVSLILTAALSYKLCNTLCWPWELLPNTCTSRCEGFTYMYLWDLLLKFEKILSEFDNDDNYSWYYLHSALLDTIISYNQLYYVGQDKFVAAIICNFVPHPAITNGSMWSYCHSNALVVFMVFNKLLILYCHH